MYYSVQSRMSLWKNSLIPRPTLFFVFRFAFRRVRKTVKTCHVNDVWWAQGGREVGVGGGGGCPTTNGLCVTNHRASFLSEVKYRQSRERLGSRLSLERSMMKCSTLFEVDGSPPPTSTSQPPDVIHVTDVNKANEIVL